MGACLFVEIAGLQFYCHHKNGIKEIIAIIWRKNDKEMSRSSMIGNKLKKTAKYLFLKGRMNWKKIFLNPTVMSS